LKDRLIIKFPYIPGRDFAGIIKKTGSKVDKLARGDRVFGYQPPKYNGSWAQHIVVNQKYACVIPENINFDEAAAIPYCALTAYHVLTEALGIGFNKKVWITNGSGGVGSWAVQIAKDLGAIVIATTSTENKGWLRKLGADEVIDYKTTKLENYPKDIDLVFDTYGNIKTLNPMKYMKAGGKIVSIVEDIDPALAQMYNVTCQYYEMQESCDKLPEILKLISGARIKYQITKKHPFVDIMEGIKASKRGHVDGKIVVIVDEKDIMKAKDLKEKMFELEKPKAKVSAPEKDNEGKTPAKTPEDNTANIVNLEPVTKGQ